MSGAQLRRFPILIGLLLGVFLSVSLFAVTVAAAHSPKAAAEVVTESQARAALRR